MYLVGRFLRGPERSSEGSMTVDFAMKKVPAIPVASIVRIGPWRPDNLRTEFGELARWAKRQHVRSGRWIFVERDSHRWEAALEVRGEVRAEGRIRRKTLPASTVAYVVFDPERVSSRIVYHGLADWTRSRRREGSIRGVRSVREVYAGDPWTDSGAWRRCEVQFLLRR